MRLTHCLHCGRTLSHGHLCLPCRARLTALVAWAAILLLDVALLALVIGALR